MAQAIFDCPFGFQLTGGPASLWCTPSGTWSVEPIISSSYKKYHIITYYANTSLHVHWTWLLQEQTYESLMSLVVSRLYGACPCPIVQLSNCSIVQLSDCSIVQLFNCSIVHLHLHKCFPGPVLCHRAPQPLASPHHHQRYPSESVRIKHL